MIGVLLAGRVADLFGVVEIVVASRTRVARLDDQDASRHQRMMFRYKVSSRVFRLAARISATMPSVGSRGTPGHPRI